MDNFKPGRQPDGSWWVPVLPLRKDKQTLAANKFGRARSKDYRDRQKEFRSYLYGMAAGLIPRVPRTKNVLLQVDIYYSGYSGADGVNGLDFVQDALEGLAFENDWQVLTATVTQHLYSGQDGVLLRFSEAPSGS